MIDFQDFGFEDNDRYSEYLKFTQIFNVED